MTRNYFEKFVPALVFGLLYFGAYQLSIWSDLVDSYAPGISLVFLPSGVRLVAILVGGFWGLLGTAIAQGIAVTDVWTTEPLWFYFVFPFVSAFSSFGAVWLMSRLLGISCYLNQLRLIHLPLIDLVATLTHGLAVNAFFVMAGLNVVFDLTTRTLAMAVGDFNGGLVVLLSMALVLKLLRLRKTNAEAEN